MKHTIFVIMVLVLSSAVLPAFSADITHHFHTKFTGSPQTLTITQNNKIGNSTNDGFTYTCGGKAEFGSKSSQICLLMNNSGDYVTLSPAVPDLSEIRINYSPFTSSSTPIYHLQVYVSADGSDWGDPLPANRFSIINSSYIKIIVPKGTSFVKVVNTDGTDLAIKEFRYTPVNCNCNTYIPE